MADNIYIVLKTLSINTSEKPVKSRVLYRLNKFFEKIGEKYLTYTYDCGTIVNVIDRTFGLVDIMNLLDEGNKHNNTHRGVRENERMYRKYEGQ